MLHIFWDYSVCNQLTHWFSFLLPSFMQTALPIIQFQRSFRGVSGPQFALSVCLLPPVQRHRKLGKEPGSRPDDLAVLHFAYAHDCSYWSPESIGAGFVNTFAMRDRESLEADRSSHRICSTALPLWVPYASLFLGKQNKNIPSHSSMT